MGSLCHFVIELWQGAENSKAEQQAPEMSVTSILTPRALYKNAAQDVNVHEWDGRSSEQAAATDPRDILYCWCPALVRQQAWEMLRLIIYNRDS